MKVKSESEVAESCLTLSDPMDCFPSGSSVHGIFQARVLECGAIAFSVNEIKHVENIQCNRATVMYLYKPAMNNCVNWELYDSKECHSHVVSTV